jgi:hypothetical protein
LVQWIPLFFSAFFFFFLGETGGNGGLTHFVSKMASVVVKIVCLCITASVLITVGFVLITLLRIDGHAGARDNLINIYIADNIIPRTNGNTGLWEKYELEERVQRMSDEITGDKQLWKSFLSEYLRWETRHKVTPCNKNL